MSPESFRLMRNAARAWAWLTGAFVLMPLAALSGVLAVLVVVAVTTLTNPTTEITDWQFIRGLPLVIAGGSLLYAPALCILWRLNRLSPHRYNFRDDNKVEDAWLDAVGKLRPIVAAGPALLILSTLVPVASRAGTPFRAFGAFLVAAVSVGAAAMLLGDGWVAYKKAIRHDLEADQAHQVSGVGFTVAAWVLLMGRRRETPRWLRYLRATAGWAPMVFWLGLEYHRGTFMVDGRAVVTVRCWGDEWTVSSLVAWPYGTGAAVTLGRALLRCADDSHCVLVAKAANARVAGQLEAFGFEPSGEHQHRWWHGRGCKDSIPMRREPQPCC